VGALSRLPSNPSLLLSLSLVEKQGVIEDGYRKERQTILGLVLDIVLNLLKLEEWATGPHQRAEGGHSFPTDKKREGRPIAFINRGEGASEGRRESTPCMEIKSGLSAESSYTRERAAKTFGGGGDHPRQKEPNHFGRVQRGGNLYQLNADEAGR